MYCSERVSSGMVTSKKSTRSAARVSDTAAQFEMSCLWEVS